MGATGFFGVDRWDLSAPSGVLRSFCIVLCSGLILHVCWQGLRIRPAD